MRYFGGGLRTQLGVEARLFDREERKAHGEFLLSDIFLIEYKLDLRSIHLFYMMPHSDKAKVYRETLVTSFC